MKITIKISDDAVSEKLYDAFSAELRARVLEVYPGSNLHIIHDSGATTFETSGFHNDNEAHVVLHELVEDVLHHGYWSK